MSDPRPLEAALFDAVLQLPSEQRPGYLDQACADDAALRQRIEALLKAGELTNGFLDQPPAPGASQAGRATSPVVEKPGDNIGPYKLLQQIGEGGCGVVYMAEQEQPVRRRVALKVIKLGMDTRSVIARFDAERQALAMMDHPNIAKVLEAGATDTGRPYFVMELVRGVKITDYCDHNNLSTADRLDLFMQVCRAIQHAHQKGIIHRDIKPSNILVTLHDGVPVPKVIDFGIAKATQGRLTDHTVFTAFEQFMGTAAYASPEQAEMSGLDIDTRSDIYSLGVLLYELLTGKTPFEAKDLLAAGLEEMRRMIREKEPDRPSMRLSTMLEAELTITATRRQTQPPRLISSLRGDLDWIVMRCLDKDRARRYETANGLAFDIQRHLNQEPVLAGPPSNLYRFRKLVRRNKMAFVAGAAVAVALVAGLVVSSWQAIRATRAEREEIRLRQQAEGDEKKAQIEAAKSQQVAQLFKDLLNGVTPSVALGRDTTMPREILDTTAASVGKNLTNQQGVEAELRASILGEKNKAVANSLNNLARIMKGQGKPSQADTALTEALALEKTLAGQQDSEIAPLLHVTADLLAAQGRFVEAERAHREALELRKRVLGGDHPTVAESLNRLVNLLLSEKKYDETERLFNTELAEAAAGRGQTAKLLMLHANYLARRSRWREAAAEASKALELAPDDHLICHALAPLLVASGDLDAYRAQCRRTLERFSGTTNPEIADRTAKDCLILPSSEVDLRAVAELAEVAVTAGKNHRYIDFFECVKALADYRLEDFSGALHWAALAHAAPTPTIGRNVVKVEACMVLAMAHFQSGHKDDARAALGEGINLAQTKLPPPDSADLGDGWIDWIIAHAMLREAKALIENSKPSEVAK